MDRQLSQLEAEIRGLPKKIADMEKAIEIHARKIEQERAALAANQAELRRLGNVNTGHRERIEKLKKQLMQATTQEQLNAFQHEIDFCEAEIHKNEESTIALLEEGDKMTRGLAESEASLANEQSTIDRRKVEAKELSETDRKTGVRLYRERVQLAKDVPQKLLDHYERLRKKHKDGIVVAECTGSLCSSCMMTIRPALMQQIRSEPERLFTCESCGRMLNYNPPVPA